jgi:hypothetical protein
MDFGKQVAFYGFGYPRHSGVGLHKGIHAIGVFELFVSLLMIGTLTNHNSQVLHDHSVSPEVLLKRTKALKILGDYFLSKGGSLAAGLGDMKARLHSQMNGAGVPAEAEEGAKQGDTTESAAASVPTTADASAAGAKESDSSNID